VEINDDAFKGTEAIIRSMTPAERSDPALLSHSRRKRIAEGSGTDINTVNKLIKQFDEMRKMMKSFTGSNAQRMMRNMPGMRR
jgi:signal recognition particle subunit SRP54